jgi:hypothetical protein
LIIIVEIHRTEKDYENALTLKMFLFQFVNFYASIFYIAFIKPWFANPPGAESYKIGKYKTEEVIKKHFSIKINCSLDIISVKLVVVLLNYLFNY